MFIIKNNNDTPRYDTSVLQFFFFTQPRRKGTRFIVIILQHNSYFIIHGKILYSGN